MSPPEYPKEHRFSYKLTYVAYVDLWDIDSTPSLDKKAKHAIDMVDKREDCMLIKVERIEMEDDE